LARQRGKRHVKGDRAGLGAVSILWEPKLTVHLSIPPAPAEETGLRQKDDGGGRVNDTGQ
jgi:hypothetical protein